MEPDLKDRNAMYRLVISQLYYDGHKQLALDLSNSIGLNPSLPPSDKLFRLVSAARLIEDDADEEEKDTDMQMSLNPVVPSIDNLSIDEGFRSYFPFLALPKELQSLVFSSLPFKDRMRARVTKSLVKIESDSKYYVEDLTIAEKFCVHSPSLHDDLPCARKIVLLESESYSTEFVRRIAHNTSIGDLCIRLNGSSEFHREVYNLIKEIDVRELRLFFNDKVLEEEMMVESFLLDLSRSCKDLITQIEFLTAETIHGVYKIMLDGSTKLRFYLLAGHFDNEKCIKFFQLIGITYRDGALFSNRDIEVYKTKTEFSGDMWHFFDGELEMSINSCIFDSGGREFYLIRHDMQKSLEGRKNMEGMEKIEIGPE